MMTPTYPKGDPQMATTNDVTQRVNTLIAQKREQIARGAENLAADMLALSKAARRGHGLGASPIGSDATYLNTLCGELAALEEARDMLAAVTA